MLGSLNLVSSVALSLIISLTAQVESRARQNCDVKYKLFLEIFLLNFIPISAKLAVSINSGWWDAISISILCSQR